jgi:hypothetical protein
LRLKNLHPDKNEKFDLAAYESYWNLACRDGSSEEARQAFAEEKAVQQQHIKEEEAVFRGEEFDKDEFTTEWHEDQVADINARAIAAEVFMI